MSSKIDPTIPLPLGPAAEGIRHPDPGTPLKNPVPEGYFHGSVGGELAYWKKRALGAEARLALRLSELEEEKKANSRLVVIESPFAGDRERNKAYLHALMIDSLRRGEFPYASHALFPYFLNDDVPAERQLGIEAGLAWGRRAFKTIVGSNLGISRGMQLGLDAARAEGREVEERSLEGWKK